MIVSVLKPARPIAVDTFADLTDKEVIDVAWNADGGLDIQFAVNLSDDEVRAVRIRAITADSTAERWLRQAWAGLDRNSDYLTAAASSDAPPSFEGVAAQVLELTKQMQRVIRGLGPVES